MTTPRLYWGDLHSHCSISYGQGTVEQALVRARQQLDFCSITGHAFWPDMPTDRQRYGEIIDYHREGFARLERNWDELLQRQAAASQDGELIVLPSYEWHSLAYGDHNVYARGPDLPLRDAPDLPALREVAAGADAILIPHHIGYAAGYRGIDWRHFDAARSPLVEVYSLHGASVSEQAAYPMLHDMGPRDAGSTAVAGWTAGHRFGIIASTDHHGGFPGSHGDGRLGVFAESLTRDSLWQALLARRTLAATGDKIDARMQVNDAWIGESIQAPGTRRIAVDVCGLDEVDRVELLKNERVVARWHPEPVDEVTSDGVHGRLRVTWGWGRKNERAQWNCLLSLSDGEILDVEPCFSGQAVVAPQGVAGHDVREDEDDLPHAIVDRQQRRVAWRSVTSGNLSTRHPTTQAMSIELRAPQQAQVVVETDAGCYQHSLGELLAGGRAHYQQGWLSAAIRVGPLTPMSRCRVAGQLQDQPQQPVDMYRLRVAQSNGQWAWLSPVWAEA